MYWVTCFHYGLFFIRFWVLLIFYDLLYFSVESPFCLFFWKSWVPFSTMEFLMGPHQPLFHAAGPFPNQPEKAAPHRSLGVCSLPRVLLPSPSCPYINCSSEMQNCLHKPCYLITPFPYCNDMGVSVRQWHSFSLLHSIWRIQWVNVCAAQTNSIGHILSMFNYDYHKNHFTLNCSIIFS